MGPGESAILEKGLTNFMGIVTNPLEQAEASKTALFAIADFAWNTADFDAEESWADGFKYIDGGASESLHELCKHMTNRAGRYHSYGRVCGTDSVYQCIQDSIQQQRRSD